MTALRVDEACRAFARAGGERRVSTAPRRLPKVLLVDDGERYAELAHALLRDYEYATRCELPGPGWTCPRRRAVRSRTRTTGARDRAGASAAPGPDVVLLDDGALRAARERCRRAGGHGAEPGADARCRGWPSWGASARCAPRCPWCS
ncbi:MAG: hypothetical protein IPG81_33435 [Sandaracinaceae bacterium]|nr:hypothetical protein [Sandaracinaceae bacterium]